MTCGVSSLLEARLCGRRCRGGADVLFPYVGSRRTDRSSFLQFAAQQAGLSDEQKKFLATLTRLFEQGNNPLLQDHPDPNGPRRVLLYAVTQEDAQKMAQAYLQYTQDAFRGDVRGFERNVQHGAEEIESTKKKMAEAEKRIEETRKSLDEFQKTVPYRTENEAHEAIGELDRMLNAAQVEIAGIKARIATIQEYQRGGPGYSRSEETLPRLAMIFIEESIALRAHRPGNRWPRVCASRPTDTWISGPLSRMPRKKRRNLRGSWLMRSHTCLLTSSTWHVRARTSRRFRSRSSSTRSSGSTRRPRISRTR